MVDVTQTLKAEFYRNLNSKISSSDLKKVSEQIGLAMIESIYERTNAGIDVNGQRFKALSPKYKSFKEKYIKGQIKGRGKKPSRTMQRLKSNLKWRAKSMPNFMRLTGALFDDIQVEPLVSQQNAQNKITISMRFKVLSGSKDKAQGLIGMGRDMFFVPTGGAYKTKQMNIARDILINYFKSKIKGKDVGLRASKKV